MGKVILYHGSPEIIHTPVFGKGEVYNDYGIAENSEYYAKRKTRDDEARAAYRAELEKDDLNGLYMRDIIRQEVQPNDPRLR